MKKYKVGILALMAFGFSATSASATSALFDYAFNVDGEVTNNAAATGVDMTYFDDWSGLGIITYTTSDVGSHSFLAFRVLTTSPVVLLVISHSSSAMSFLMKSSDIRTELLEFCPETVL